jgi:two-component system response regulator AtoC
MPTHSILVVDDEESLLFFLQNLLEKEGYIVSTASNGTEALEKVPDEDPDLVLLDLMLPDMDGVAVLEKIREYSQDTIVIILTAYGTVDSAVQAMKLGAFDYLAKPFDPAELRLILQRAMGMTALRHELQHLRQEQMAGFSDFIGASKAMRQVYRLISKVARSGNATVLIEGESGTGKELAARTIHARSDRTDGPFVAINCGAFPENLLESELFGHEAGAFTDARRKKRGLLELAHGGTMFLDEVSEMSQSMQVKLLRVLEGNIFKRLGGERDVEVDVRFIAATNKSLRQEVMGGRFREDLFYRLEVVLISMPPLRERREDIPLLAMNFIEEFNKTCHRKVHGISTEAMGLLTACDWPGNVRELRNAIERAMILGSGPQVLPEHLPIQVTTPVKPGAQPVERERPAPAAEEMLDDGFSLQDALNSLEKEFIVRALNEADSNQRQAARILGLDRQTLRYRMKKHGLL